MFVLSPLPTEVLKRYSNISNPRPTPDGLCFAVPSSKRAWCNAFLPRKLAFSVVSYLAFRDPNCGDSEDGEIRIVETSWNCRLFCVVLCFFFLFFGWLWSFSFVMKWSCWSSERRRKRTTTTTKTRDDRSRGYRLCAHSIRSGVFVVRYSHCFETLPHSHCPGQVFFHSAKIKLNQFTPVWLFFVGYLVPTASSCG